MAGPDAAAPRRLVYGIDAPGALVGAIAGGLVLVVIGVTVFPLALWLGLVLLAYAAGHVGASLVGKVLVARRMIREIPWRGDETVLDVGCGHGLLLIEAARRLTTGRAVGIDIWSQKDQWRNSRGATEENARRAGVGDRVEVRDADARELPFPDASFDVVVSSLVIHNIPGREQRTKALREILRVLKPGGRVAILDLAETGHYARELEAGGLVDVHRSAPVGLFLPSTRKVTARKPA